MQIGFSKKFISLADIYVAYRKAKSEAFYDGMHPSAIAFTKYETNLTRNLRKLHADICSKEPSWYLNTEIIGGYMYVPKSLDESAWDNNSGIHFRAIDPIVDWERRFEYSNKKKLAAKYRLIIAPTVEFQIISALWILKVGHLYEEKLDKRLSYGNRLRRSEPHIFAHPDTNGPLNTDSLGLFTPYFSAYQKWRENGLSSMRDSVLEGKSITAITMDLASFYHNVSPAFIVRKGFLKKLGVELNTEQRKFTTQLLDAIRIWYENTPDHKERPKGALPVGLSASKVISNILLHQLDKESKECVSPVYYGRYVDDIFMVIETPQNVNTGHNLIQYLAKKIPCLKYKPVRNNEPELKIDITSASDSDLFFTANKQKIFTLSSKHGLDLVDQIAAQIRTQSSEYRLLPNVPDTASEMAAKALLATPDASLAADALRKADVVTVRRLGFSLLLKDIESYSTDLPRNSWGSTRKEFYSLVQRHLLTPKGIFDFSSYLQRVFSLMVANQDFTEANDFIKSLSLCFDLLERTTSSESEERYSLCRDYFAKTLLQAATQASTTRGFRKHKELGSLLRKLFKFNNTYRIPSTETKLRELSHNLLLSDLGRRPYKDYWYYDQTRDINNIRMPRERAVYRVIRLGAIRRYRKDTDLRTPHWPALAFPTRPVTIQEIALTNPNVLESSRLFKSSIKGLRGAGVWRFSSVGFSENNDMRYFSVPHETRNNVVVALTNIETTDNQWESAATNSPDYSLKRYKNLCNLINKILKEKTKPDYVVFPEMSVPRRWAIGFADKLARQDISFLCGIEYYKSKKIRSIVRNDSLVSLATRWPGYRSNIIYMQPKLKPSHTEKIKLKSVGKKQYEPTGLSSLPIYNHGGFYFGILICSDLTNPTNRVHFQGKVDTLFVQEWNRDVKTFSFLVEGAAHDIHTFVVQVNNRLYGDSRIRAPYRKDYLRDSVRVKGGISDYFVIGTIDYMSLRRFQKINRMTNKNSEFKPVPIGFVISNERKILHKS